MPSKNKVSPTLHPSAPESTEELIRMRAYQLFEQRGCGHGNDLDDWIQAEAEVLGRKPSASADQTARAQDAAAAAAA